MNTIKMKITGYDQATQSLLVSFASDTTQLSAGEYASLAFSPAQMWPDVTDVQQILRKIAEAGVVCAAQIENMETFANNSQTINSLQALVGQDYEFSVASLAGPQL